MNEMFFRISSIQRKMEANNNLQTIIKVITGLLVFTIFFCSLNQANAMNVAWIISMLVIVLLFIFDSYYVKNNKKYEPQIYQLEVDELTHKKEVAKIIGEPLSDVVLTREIKKTMEDVSLPILYYAIMLILDIIIKIIMIR